MSPRLADPAARRPLLRSARAAALALALTATTLPAPAQGVLVGRVVRVHDGDSVTLSQGPQRMPVRLAAIDAPELGQPHGEAARDALQTCAFGRVVMVQVHGSDRHGRTVGQLEASDRDCALVLLRAGLAWHYKAYAHEQPRAEQFAYAAAERDARRRRLGIWSEEAPQPPWEWRRAHHSGDGGTR